MGEYRRIVGPKEPSWKWRIRRYLNRRQGARAFSGVWPYFPARANVILLHPASTKSVIVYLTRARRGETFRLELNQSWKAIDIQTGVGVVIPKGSNKAVCVLHHAARDVREEPWLVVTVQHGGQTGFRPTCAKPTGAKWKGHHIPEFRMTIEQCTAFCAENMAMTKRLYEGLRMNRHGLSVNLNLLR